MITSRRKSSTRSAEPRAGEAPVAARDARSARERANRRRALATYLPYHDFLDGVVALVDGGRVVTGLALNPLAGDALTNAELNSVFAGARRFLVGAPDDVELQFIYTQRRATVAEIELSVRHAGAPGDGDAAAFAASRREHLAGRARAGHLFESVCYLFATLAPSPFWYVEGEGEAPWYDRLRAQFSTTGRTFRRRSRAEHEAMLVDARRQTDHLVRDLEAFGVTARTLSDAETFTLIFEYLNPRRRAQPLRRPRDEYRYAPDAPDFYDRFPEARPLSPREQLAFSELVLAPTHLSVDGILTRTLYLKVLPEHASPGMIEHLTDGLRFPFTLSLNIRIPSKSEELAKLRRRMRIQQSILSTTIGNIKPDTTDAEVAYRQLKHLTYSAIENVERALYLGLTITVEAQSVAELEDYTNQITTAVRSMNLAEAVYDRHNARDLWLCTAPGNSRRDYWKLWTTVECAASMLPVLGKWRGTHGRPFVVYPNRKGELVRLDPTMLPTPHFAILGVPGSGKSVLMTDMILRHMQDASALCYVVDSTGSESAGTAGAGVGRSAGGFERLAGVLEGAYILCDLSQMPNLNPLAIRPRDGEAEGLDCTDDGIPFAALASAVRFVETLALEPNEEALGKEYVNLITYVLQRVLFNHPDAEDPPIMRNFLEELSAFKDSYEHARTLYLRLLSTGSENTHVGRYLNRRDRVFDPERRFLVFDMHGIERYSEYKRSVMMLVTSFLDRQVIRHSNAPRRKLILYDEAGRYLNGPMGMHMSHFAATLRKRNAVLGFATQAISDLMEASAGQRLIANCGTLFILKVHQGVDEFCRVFGLTRRDAELIAGLSTAAFGGRMAASREAFLKVGDFRTVLNVDIDDPTYWLSTSHPPDVRLLRAWERLVGVPGRDVSHHEFYARIAEALPDRRAASDIDLDVLEAEIDRRLGDEARARPGRRR
jgi:hypothetical protein